jgi:hypothetical protein
VASWFLDQPERFQFILKYGLKGTSHCSSEFWVALAKLSGPYQKQEPLAERYKCTVAEAKTREPRCGG